MNTVAGATTSNMQTNTLLDSQSDPLTTQNPQSVDGAPKAYYNMTDMQSSADETAPQNLNGIFAQLIEQLKNLLSQLLHLLSGSMPSDTPTTGNSDTEAPTTNSNTETPTTTPPADLDHLAPLSDQPSVSELKQWVSDTYDQFPQFKEIYENQLGLSKDDALAFQYAVMSEKSGENGTWQMDQETGQGGPGQAWGPFDAAVTNFKNGGYDNDILNASGLPLPDMKDFKNPQVSTFAGMKRLAEGILKAKDEMGPNQPAEKYLLGALAHHDTGHVSSANDQGWQDRIGNETMQLMQGFLDGHMTDEEISPSTTADPASASSTPPVETPDQETPSSTASEPTQTPSETSDASQTAPASSDPATGATESPDQPDNAPTTPVEAPPTVDTNSDSDQPVAPLSVSGNQVMRGDQPANLEGASLFWSNDGWGGEKFYTPETVSTLKNDWNADVVRASMGVDESGGYIDDPAGNMQKVKTVIDAAIKNNMYVIVDWHSHHAEQNTDKAKEFFDEISKAYGDNNNIIYEVYNEPTQVSWSNDIKPYAEDVISTIRQNDPDNLVVVGTPTWSQDVDQAAQDPINDPNVAYSLHFYAGTHGQDLRNKAQTAMDNGIPLFVTEWGTVNANGDGGVDQQSTDAWMDFLKANNISNVAWAVNDKAEGASTFTPGGSWDSLTDSGQKVKEIIQD